MSKQPEVSFVVPLYNESAGLRSFHESLAIVANKATDAQYEIVYVDDGSTDDTEAVIRALHGQDPRVKLVRLSRNFGKELALSAGIALARGRAIITLDGDGQHPITLIPEFIKLWQQGVQVVVGIRQTSQSDRFLKRLGSRLFYRLFNGFAEQKFIPGSTDYRLIDREVQQQFVRLQENDRITRGLIDWLGFRRECIYFDAGERQQGAAAYSYQKLLRLAITSFTSLTPTPLYLFGYIGLVTTALAALLGAAIIVEQLLLGDPLRWRFTGTAMLAILVIFLVGILLLSQAVMALYIASIQTLTRQRPLYIIDRTHSVGLQDDEPTQ